MAKRSLPIALTRAYGRTDFTALRAFVQGVPSATLARPYFSEYSDGQCAHRRMGQHVSATDTVRSGGPRD